MLDEVPAIGFPGTPTPSTHPVAQVNPDEPIVVDTALLPATPEPN